MTQLVLNLSMLGPKPTGLGVYSEHCAHAISSRFDAGLIAGHGALPDARILVRAPESVAIGGGKVAAMRRQFWMRGLDFGRDALVYSPTHHGLPSQTGQIITIHDLICLRFPAQHWPQYLFFRFGLPRLLKKCRAVFTVSETTRQDVAQTYSFPEERIFVVPNGVDRTVFSAESPEPVEQPYLLMVGARYPHKNVDEVLDQYRLWSGRYHLRVTSCGGKYRERLESRVRQLGISDRVSFLDYISREELIELYRRSSALLYPSKWEGFGIPPLEALACGTPVIASDIPVHREVLGAAGLFVTLGDVQSWSDALGALSQPERLSRVREAGGRVLDQFSWSRSADALQESLLAVEPHLAQRLKSHVSGVRHIGV